MDGEFTCGSVPLQHYLDVLNEKRRERELRLQEKIRQLQQQAEMKERIHSEQLHSSLILYTETQQAKAALEKHIEQLLKELEEYKILTAKLMKQKGRETNETALDSENEEMKGTEEEEKTGLSEKDEMIQSLKDKIDEEKREEKRLREELNQEIDILQLQLQANSQRPEEVKDIGIQFDFTIPQFGKYVCMVISNEFTVSDILQDSGVRTAGQNLFVLQGDSPCSFNWEQYGFRLHSPQGTLQPKTDTCEVAVTPLVSGSFSLPNGTVLVSAVYAISVSKTTLKATKYRTRALCGSEDIWSD